MATKSFLILFLYHSTMSELGAIVGGGVRESRGKSYLHYRVRYQFI
jgi:hypothetical protein